MRLAMINSTILIFKNIQQCVVMKFERATSFLSNILFNSFIFTNYSKHVVRLLIPFNLLIPNSYVHCSHYKYCLRSILIQYYLNCHVNVRR